MLWFIVFVIAVVFIIFVAKTNKNTKKQIDEEIEELLKKEKKKTKEENKTSYDNHREEWNSEQVKKTKDYKDYLMSLEWHNLKRQVYVRDNYRCRQCSKDLSKMNGNVHHITYDRVYNEQLEDLVLVCPSCHNIIHTYYARLMPGTKKFNILSSTQYIEAVDLSTEFY